MLADVGQAVISSTLPDRERPRVPMTYREIADDLAARIRAGEFTSGSKLPTTIAFAEHYDVSEATAYRALSLLVDRGLIHGEPGRGRFVE